MTERCQNSCASQLAAYGPDRVHNLYPQPIHSAAEEGGLV